MQSSTAEFASETHGEPLLDTQIQRAVSSNLFDERPLCLNAIFRFQIGNNTFDGYEFAKEAWKRVATVTSSTGSNTNTGFGQSLEALRVQKDAVKKELKQFDLYFCKFYGRQPSRLDKECLRKLYEFHKQLKAYITAEEAKAERTNMLQRSRAAVAGPVTPSGRGDGHAQAMHPTNLPSNNPLPTPQVMSSQIPSNEKVLTWEMDERVLRAEKRALKIKLRRFEDEFFRQHGHKPQSYQEVGSVREDYSRYKYLKETLQAAGGEHTPPRPNGSLSAAAAAMWHRSAGRPATAPGAEPGPGRESDRDTAASDRGRGAAALSPRPLSAGSYGVGRSILSP